MKEFIIRENDADQRVDKFILKAMKTMPKSLMYKYIRNKKIKVNRKRCEISQRLQVGDTVQCYIPEEFYTDVKDLHFLQVSVELDVRYEDANIVILNKPKGLRAHSDTQEIQDNLVDRLLHYLYNKGEYDPSQEQSFTPALCHRIDRNTQGLVIAAKTAKALRCMNTRIAQREVEKRYVCIVEGHMEQTQAHVVLYHQKQEGNIARISEEPKEGYQRMESSYHVLRQSSDYALVEVQLHTGKSHQIRAMMAWLHHPLLGDVKYGAHKTRQKDYQALCAYYLAFHFRTADGCLDELNGSVFQLEQCDVIRHYERLTAT